MEKLIIKREVSCWRPLILKGKQLTNIIFYKDNKIIYQSNCGWLEHGKHDVLSITIDAPKKANKLNLNRRDNFYMNAKKSYKDGYDLYLYIDGNNINLQNEREIIGSYNQRENCFQTSFELTIDCTIQDWKLSEDDKKLIYYESDKTGKIEVKTGYTRIELKPLGEKIAAIVKLIDDTLGEHRISTYDIEKLLPVLDITIL